MKPIQTIAFIGLGNVGSKLAGSLLRNGFKLIVRDLNEEVARPLLNAGATFGESPFKMTQAADLLITCLPDPAASATVLEDQDGALSAIRDGKIWAEMSTTDEREVVRLGALVKSQGGVPVDCPVSGGCHRAATGNISIFAGCERQTFEHMLPVLTAMGRRILHTGRLGSASILKVVTNYLATANLMTLCEALATSKAVGMDLGIAYEAIRISSGHSFVHETESQIILNGSRDIQFTMDLVCKDITLFDEIAKDAGIPLDFSPLMVKIFKEAMDKYGAREHSPNIIKRLEEASGLDITAPGFPSEIIDDEPEESGYEVSPYG